MEALSGIIYFVLIGLSLIPCFIVLVLAIAFFHEVISKQRICTFTAFGMIYFLAAYTQGYFSWVEFSQLVTSS